MYRCFWLLLWPVLLAVLAACATPTTKPPKVDSEQVVAERKKQSELAVQNLFDAYIRLYNVSYPLIFAAEPLCENALAPRMGWLIANKYDLSGDMREAAVNTHNLGEHFQVLHVVPNTPAANAGIRKGDVLHGWNGHPMPTGDQEDQRFNSLRKAFMQSKRDHVIELERNGQRMTVLVESRLGCESQLLWIASDEVNAFADGEYIGITRGMMRFAQSDIQLANVVAHELAHNVKKHITARRKNSMLGLLLDLVSVGSGGPAGFQLASMYHFSPEFEAEADYVGLYILALAGKDYAAAPDFWRQMAVNHPGSIAHKPGGTHPGTAERFVKMAAAVAEIKAKQTLGLPFFPESK